MFSLVACSVVLAACGAGPSSSPGPGVIQAIGAESVYANVLAQLGGKYIQVSSILNNPSADPHTFEASASVAQEVAQAGLIVQNGLGYDAWMNTLESAPSAASRRVIVAQNVLGLPDATPNPHLWYDPTTMPAVARAITADLVALQPTHASYFHTSLAAFLASLKPWFASIARFKSTHDHTPVAVTEPVSDYLLEAMGMQIETPFAFQADVMNGVDPSPEAISLVNGLISNHLVKVFCFNEQVVSALTASIRQSAISSSVPIVTVYETMPAPGYDFQTWMLAEVDAIQAAVDTGASTLHL
jgi:zinc/manganese transport system substrate-binding protein